MAEPLGHVAIALLFALPAWILWDGRTGAAFVAFVVAASTIPDVDMVLMEAGLPVEHHGVAHTVPFVLAYSLVGGVLATTFLRPRLARWWRLTEDEEVQRGTIFLFVTGGFALGGLSHLAGDAITTSGYEPIEPLWPVLQAEIDLGLAHYTSVWVNGAVLAIAVPAHLAVVLSGAFPIEHRFRRWCAELGE